MAEEQGFVGMDEGFANGADTMPQVGMISQYVKDLSFENPNAPAVYQWQAQPSIDVQFNIGAATVGEDVHEVSLKIEVTASADGNTAFAVEILYAGLFAIRNVPDEQMQPFLLAEAPRLLFPFARRVIADMTAEGGFPPFLIEPIDFAGVYAAQRAASEGGEGPGVSGMIQQA